MTYIGKLVPVGLALIAVGAPLLLAMVRAPKQTTPPPPASPTPAPVTGSNGLVSAADPLAAEAGIAVLKKGGNAFDAAVAVAAMLNVVEPNMSGMGGYGTILVYHAKTKEILFLNPSGRIPAAVDSDVFRAPTPGYEKNREGAKAVSTPGNVHAWEAMSQRFGKLAWAELFEAAIRTAERGFILNQNLAANMKAAFKEFPKHARAFYGEKGLPLQTGARLIQKDLGRSLRAVAEGGAKAFYDGEIGRAIDAEMKKSEGFLSLARPRGGQSRMVPPDPHQLSRLRGLHRLPAGEFVLFAHPAGDDEPVRPGGARLEHRALSPSVHRSDQACLLVPVEIFRRSGCGNTALRPSPGRTVLEGAGRADRSRQAGAVRLSGSRKIGDAAHDAFRHRRRRGEHRQRHPDARELLRGEDHGAGHRDLAEQLALLLHFRAQGKPHGRPRRPAEALRRLPDDHPQGRRRPGRRSGRRAVTRSARPCRRS